MKVIMERVAVGRAAGGFGQAVGIRCRQEWHRHKMSRKQLVGTTGQRVQADGGREVRVGGAGDFGGMVGANSGGHKVEERSQGVVEGEGASNHGMEMGKGQSWKETRCMTKVENGQRHGRRGALAAPCYVWSHFYYSITLYELIVNLFIYSIKMVCSKNEES